jgi:uncharacterized membrane protein
MQNTTAMTLTAGLVCLAAGIAGAQQTMPVVVPPFTQVQSSGMAGITAGQTARLSALNPGVPAPLATAARCPAHVAFRDDQGNLLKSTDIMVDPGKSVSVDLDRDTDVSTATLEIFDNVTSKTQFVLSDFGFTYPLALTGGVVTPGMMR